MLYAQKKPDTRLNPIIKRFWMADSRDDRTVHQQKIIPDGYPEIIFHYGDPYRIKINAQWKIQSRYLLAGQMTHFFYLRNTGKTGMFAITLQPWALKKLFSLNMTRLVDQVLPIDRPLVKLLLQVKNIAVSSMHFDEKTSAVEKWFYQYLKNINTTYTKGEKAAEILLIEKGKITVQEILKRVDISEKSLERYFRSNIGLTPKFYSRIIRMSHIFSLVNENNINWSEVAFLTGFYDQSHFIKNFKEFTGEEPSNYGFDEKNMANFFLKS
jgi:AraC-like DNA-binding protein